MSVIINLREIFATDSQAAASDKLNFNFNQLLALGVGQPGPIGPQGQTGAAGPAGPIGPQGPTGSVIFGQTTAVAPVTPPANVPTGLTTGDILIGSDKIYKKTLTGWLEIADFNALVVTAIGANISPFLRLGGTSRIVKHRVSNGIDLSNSASQSNPTYPTPGVGTNYQTVLYNFNELKTRSFKIDQFGNISISSNAGSEKTFTASSTGAVNISTNQITITSHGFSNGTYVTYTAEGGTPVGGLSDNTGYYVLSINSNTLQLCETAEDVTNNNPIDLTSLGSGSSAHKLTSYPSPPDAIFPATSNLSLYSFYDNTATTAKEFETNPTARGYRAQLEIGSVDTLSAAYPGGLSSTEYLISPSFENLRIRKYRLGGFSISGGSAQHPGTYMLRAEYDISSSGLETNALFSPRRNSEHVWRINKAGASQAVGRTVEMKFTNSHVLDNTEAALGVSLDGVFFKRNATYDGTTGAVAAFGIGFNVTNNGISFQASAGVPNFTFNKSIQVSTAGAQSTTITESGITGTPTAVWSLVVPTGSMLISSSGTLTAQSAGNFVIQTTNPGSVIRLNQAIKVKADRLDAGLPFPTTQVPSQDVNTLDDYVEGTLGSGNSGRFFINRFSIIQDQFTNVYNHQPIDCAVAYNNFVVSSSYTYTKVGRLVTVNAQMSFNLNNWPQDFSNQFGTFYYTALGVNVPYTPIGTCALNVDVVDGAGNGFPNFLPQQLSPAGDGTYTNFKGIAIPLSSGDESYSFTNLGIYLLSNTELPKDLLFYAFNPQSSGVVDTGSNLINIPGHGLVTGQKVFYSSGGGTAIGGLTNSSTYYICVFNQNSIGVSTTPSNAMIGTIIDLTTTGTGTGHSFTLSSPPVPLIRPVTNRYIMFDRDARAPLGDSVYSSNCTIYVTGSYETIS